MKFTEVVEGTKSALGINPVDHADPDMQEVMKAFAELGPKPIEHLSVEHARQQPTPADAVKKLLRDKGQSIEPQDSVSTEDINIPGAAGSNKARIYRAAGSSFSPAPLILYFHGGGWVIADLDVYDATPRAIAEQTGAIVVSAQYRQAPEHKFPAAHEDAFAAYRWLIENAEALGGDAERIAVMGESAGGNLAINVSIWARDQGLPLPVHQALIYPVAGIDTENESYEEAKHARPLNKAMMGWFMDKTLERPGDKESILLDVVEADLSELPDTTLVTAGIDPLRSEGELLAERLADQGVNVSHRNYAGATHEFFGMAAVVQAARDAQQFVTEGLQQSFARSMQ
jgi:acetyl esterase